MANTVVHKHLDATGLTQVWAAILAGFVKQEAGKGLSANDLTNELLAKLNSIADGAQVNVIESVSVNGTKLTITEKGVNVQVPTGALASLDKVKEADLDTALAAIITAKAEKTYVDEELEKKATKATTLAGYGIADAYTKEQTYSKTEADNAIDAKVKTAVAGVYKVKGSVAFAAIPAQGMVVGDVYNITDAFTAGSAFITSEQGKAYPAGTNIVYTETGWDVMAGTYDFSDFLKRDEVSALSSEEIAEICKVN